MNEFSESYLLPKDLNLVDLKSSWNDAGLLTIEAKLPKLVESAKAVKEIKIEHLPSCETKKVTPGKNDL